MGVVGVEGEFSAGDAVDVAGIEGAAFARGLVSYGSEQLLSKLGRAAGREVIHRDHLVVLAEEEA